MIAPLYIVVNGVIKSFGTLVNVALDGNYFFTTHCEAMNHLDTDKSEPDIDEYRNTVYNYDSKMWETIICKTFDSFGRTHYGNIKR